MESVLKKILDFRAASPALSDFCNNIIGMGLHYGKQNIGVSITTDNLKKVYHLGMIKNFKDGQQRTLADIFEELTLIIIKYRVGFIAIGRGHISSPDGLVTTNNHVTPFIEHLERYLPEGVFLQVLNDFGTTKIAKHSFGREFTEEEKQRISKTWRDYWCNKEASTYILMDCIARDSFYREYCVPRLLP